ncbi:hypothetical protein Tco_0265115 [Tanacetum coccineum]
MGDTIVQIRFKNVSKHSNDSLLARGYTLQSDEDRLKHYEFIELYYHFYDTRVLDLEKDKDIYIMSLLHLKIKHLHKPKVNEDLFVIDPGKSTTTQSISSQQSQLLFDGRERLAREKVEKEKEANIGLIETWDDIQAKIDDDYQLAERLQVQEQEELSDAEKATLFQQLLEKRRKHFAAKRAEEKRNKPHHTKVSPEKKILYEEEVAIDAIPLAVKSLNIIDWKIHKEGRKSYYQIIKADGKSQIRLVVVDFEPDPRVPLILGRCFLKTSRALIDVYEGELTLRVDNEAITYNLDQTSRYSVNYNDMTANRIDVVELACEEYSQEVLGFSDVIAKEADAFLALADDPTSPEVDESYYDPEGDILILEALLNSDPSPPPNQGNYLPEIRKELKICEAKTAKSSIDEPPEVELKDLPPHLEYAFLEDNNKLPVIIAKDLSVDDKTALIKVLKFQKQVIAWKLSDIKGINLEFYSHKILIEDDYELAVQHQRRVNPNIHDVIKKEVEKLLDAGLIYPISDSPWVSPVHCVPKKGGMNVIDTMIKEIVPTIPCKRDESLY